ncbi:glycosyltransferase [Mycobacterium kansasii]|uniref:glycosyltransferase n=1 Tax=Mycobacterium kansasii TaxID=1768 RepID=UPI000CDDCA50|nr:glycosyltransferase [Mycobacterium kansasii]POX87473.1 glycosyltransferase [Mycobacterium kansasii]POX98986.1 glycosyltransferase [Mycobacterium kansasii]POY22422.1 glycosyltransferase [Mycobacterium kansasii]
MKVVVAGYGSRGDIEPCTAVARELLRRGHDVCMAVPPNMLGFVESAGLAGVAYGPDSREQMNPAMDLVRDFVAQTRNPIGLLSQVIEHVSRVNADKSAVLMSLAAGADLLLASFNEQRLAANVAEYHGIPAAALHFFPARLWASGGMSPLITAAVDEAQRHSLGLPTPEPDEPPPMLEIQAYEELCLPGPAADWLAPHGWQPFVGALTLQLPTGADDEVLSWMAAGTPPIYFGFGSTPIERPADTVAMISAACAELGERALICSGVNDFRGIAHAGHLKIVDAVNHAAVFPGCRAVVHHGGAGTTAAGMRAGIPTLILWLWLDQPVWAVGVNQLGIGVGRAFSATTQDTLVADLRSILTPQCLARAREVAAQLITPAKSIALAADLLEDTARRGSTE